MKFVIRRAVVSAVAMPVVAGAYVALNAVLIGFGAEPTATASKLSRMTEATTIVGSAKPSSPFLNILLNAVVIVLMVVYRISP